MTLKDIERSAHDAYVSRMKCFYKCWNAQINGINDCPCEECSQSRAEDERRMSALVQEYALRRGFPKTSEGKESLNAALCAIQSRLDKEPQKHTITYKDEDLLESEHWWYVPYRWIGCAGFFVDKLDLYVDWLGSGAIMDLDNILWGHNHGIICDLVDFEFAPNTPRESAGILFTHVPAVDENYWDPSLVPDVFAAQFPMFRRHFVWSAIPMIRAAYDQGLRFSCVRHTHNPPPHSH